MVITSTEAITTREFLLPYSIDSQFMLIYPNFYSLPFVYSVNNKDIEQLNSQRFKGDVTGCEKGVCEGIRGECRPHTSLQVSWSRSRGKVYAHTYLSKRPVCFIFS